MGIKPEEAVHVGDDRRNDVWGARDAGCDAWLWGSDVHSFKEVSPNPIIHSFNLGLTTIDPQVKLIFSLVYLKVIFKTKVIFKQQK